MNLNLNLNLLPQPANAGSDQTLIRFAEPTAVDTVFDKRSLLLSCLKQMQTPEICICASARGPKVGLQWSGPRANNGPVPEPIPLPHSDKRYAWANNAGDCTL